mmetsp:Transcript_19729/g.27515  ORF Transcript_19729/g.27515 Transcript_19729/m.27515 type:complete len:997 (-) Transcript_19729:49-3039(-)
MEIIVGKEDVSWLQQKGFISSEQVGVVWNQLSQKCMVLNDGVLASKSKTNFEVPSVSGAYLEQHKSNDICIVFSFTNGEALARKFRQEITRSGKTVSLFAENNAFDTTEIEKKVANSTALVVLLTKDCLKQVEVVFALNAAKVYFQHPSLVILVHAAESCFFPGPDEQPESVREFFSEKAVTYLSCYLQDAIEEILTKFTTEARVLSNILAKKESESQNESHEESSENITTRVFLSHKRSTGQGIAGRLYEGLKNDYNVFIDSEAKFKIHNLKMLVQNTDVFVFILTYGIFLSHWCLEELKAAIASRKRIIVVRELAFNYPETLPDEWKEVESVLRRSQELLWIAEYNSACIRELTKYIGSCDRHHLWAKEYFETEEGKTALEQICSKLQSDKVLDLGRTISLPWNAKPDAAADFVLLRFPANEITAVQISNASDTSLGNAGVLDGLFARLPNLQEIDIAQAGRYPFDQKLLVKSCPLLRKLKIEHVEENIDGEALSKLEQLQVLDLAKVHTITDQVIEQLARCPQLHTLIVPHAKITPQSLESVAKLSCLKHLELPYKLKNSKEANKFAEEHSSVKVVMQPWLVEIKHSWQDKWQIGIPYEFGRGNQIHCYGCNITYSWTSQELKENGEELGNHKDMYAAQEVGHCADKCDLCAPFHEMFRHTLFAGKPNYFWVNEWYFEHPEGIQFLQDFVEQAKQGKLSFRKWPTGVAPEIFLTALAEKTDLNLIKSISFATTPYEVCTRILQGFPLLESVYDEHYVDDGVNQFIDCLPASLQELHVSNLLSTDTALYLASKRPNITRLMLTALRPAPKIEAIIALCGQNCKLTKFTMTNSGATTSLIKHLSEHAIHLTDLNITISPNVNEEAIPFLTSGFPQLQRLQLDPVLARKPAFEEFLKVHPGVVVEDSSKLRDIRYMGNWYPAIETSPSVFHLYGIERRDMGVDDEERDIQPFMTHSNKYGSVSCEHRPVDCYKCANIHLFCSNLLFAGEKNPFVHT